MGPFLFCFHFGEGGRMHIGCCGTGMAVVEVLHSWVTAVLPPAPDSSAVCDSGWVELTFSYKGFSAGLDSCTQLYRSWECCVLGGCIEAEFRSRVKALFPLWTCQYREPEQYSYSGHLHNSFCNCSELYVTFISVWGIHLRRCYWNRCHQSFSFCFSPTLSLACTGKV